MVGKHTNLGKNLSFRFELDKGLTGEIGTEELCEIGSSEVISSVLKGVVGIRLCGLFRVGEFSLESLDLIIPTPEMQLIRSIFISVIMPPVSLIKKIQDYRRYIERGGCLLVMNHGGRVFSIRRNHHVPGDHHCSDKYSTCPVLFRGLAK